MSLSVGSRRAAALDGENALERRNVRSIPVSLPYADDVSHALAARTMPSHLHDRADLDVRPRAFFTGDHEPGLVGDLVRPGASPANGCEGAGPIVARGHGTAASG